MFRIACCQDPDEENVRMFKTQPIKGETPEGEKFVWKFVVCLSKLQVCYTSLIEGDQQCMCGAYEFV